MRTRARVGSTAVTAILLLAWAVAPAAAEGWEASGSVGGEVRWFPESPAFPGQLEDVQVSLIAEPEVTWKSSDGRRQWHFQPFGRLDSEDDERSHFDVREAYWQYAGDDWDLRAGIGKVFWGVAESRHLVDTINQVDGVEDIDEEDKLGQPMIQLGFQRDWGRVELFVLPGFRERTFPGLDGRLRPPAVVDTDAARYESSAEETHVDVAARYSHYFGSIDIAASYFWGTGREPRLVPAPGGASLIPHYDLVHQLGVELQYTRESWLWKLEAIGREGQGETFAAAVAGFEYTLYSLRNSSLDLGLLLEALWDGRDSTAPPTPLDDDIFAGARLAFNDTQDTSILAGAIVDRNDGSVSGLVELQRRLGSRTRLDIEGRFFTAVDAGNFLETVERDSFLQVRYGFYF